MQGIGRGGLLSHSIGRSIPPGVRVSYSVWLSDLHSDTHKARHATVVQNTAGVNNLYRLFCFLWSVKGYTLIRTIYSWFRGFVEYVNQCITVTYMYLITQFWWLACMWIDQRFPHTILLVLNPHINSYGLIGAHDTYMHHRLVKG